MNKPFHHIMAEEIMKVAMVVDAASFQLYRIFEAEGGNAMSSYQVAALLEMVDTKLSDIADSLLDPGKMKY